MNRWPDLLTVDIESREATRRFLRSVRDTGFAVVRSHSFDFAALRAAYAGWRRFFESPAKHGYHYCREAQDGYYPLAVSEVAVGHGQKDLKEFFHFHPWGRHPELLGALTRPMYDALLVLGQSLLQWLKAAAPVGTFCGFTDPLRALLADSPDTVLRILRYPPLDGREPMGAMRSAPHADISLLSLLPAATAPGLQVCDPDGVWRPVPWDANSIIVNAGDMLQLCSQGHYKSAQHRVVNPEGELAAASRLSMVLFLHPQPQVRLSATHTAGSYLKERLQQIQVL